jgi:membrane protein YqaA with SNARE-associated domain
MTTGALAALAGLFLAAFGAATILPFQSEVVFAVLMIEEVSPVWLLVTVASIGNTLGSVVNYFMGLFIEYWKDRRWFPATPRQLERVRLWYLKYGVWTLLLSWAPFGDPITVIAGVLRTPFWLFLLLVSIAKTGRYIVLAWLMVHAV